MRDNINHLTTIRNALIINSKLISFDYFILLDEVVSTHLNCYISIMIIVFSNISLKVFSKNTFILENIFEEKSVI